MRSPVLLVVVLMASGSGRAEEPKKLVGTKKTRAPKLDLAMPKFEQLPSGQGLDKPAPQPASEASRHAEEGPPYSIVSVIHAKSFAGTAQGLKPSGTLTQVTVSGKPLATEPFSTVVRVRSPQRHSASIEVQVLDGRESTVMEARGELVFKNSDEAEWAVDWAPTGVRSAGDFQVQVRVAGALVGSTPLRVAEAR